MNNLKKKYEIILGTVTLIISYSAFKEQLSKIIIPFSNFYNLELSDYIFYCIVGFSFSLYLYVIERIFADTKFATLKIFDYLILFAYILFVLIIISPIILTFTYILLELFMLFKKTVSENETEFVDDNTYIFIFILFLIQGIVIATNIGKSIKSSIRNSEISEREEKQIAELESAIRLHKDQYYCQSIFESFKLIDSILKTKLITNGKRYSSTTLKNIEILKNENLITPELYIKINELRKLRNEIAHSNNVECNEANSQNALDLVKELNKF